MYVLISYDLKNADKSLYDRLNELIDYEFRNNGVGERLTYPIRYPVSYEDQKLPKGDDLIKQGSQHIYYFNPNIGMEGQRNFIYHLANRIKESIGYYDKLIVAPIYEDFCFKANNHLMTYSKNKWYAQNLETSGWDCWDGSKWVSEGNIKY